ncbi:MAG: ATP-binding protein [Bacteroidia bacterium]|nr:ATP-binding protein [Bacteroidia bacterium]
MLERTTDIEAVKRALRLFPVVGIVGARQVGKTTLAQSVGELGHESVTHFDLENPEDLARLREAMPALKGLSGLVILDEVQRMPDLFSVLRVLADRSGNSTRFLVLGSASPELLRQGSESLAGRVFFHELRGFSLSDTGIAMQDQLWLRGGFPRSFLAASEEDSVAWRRAFIRTFLERDLPQLGVTISAETLRRFWTMLAHRHGQLWNSSDFARSFGVADTTVRGYLDTLTAALVVSQLRPWHENLSKRQVKSPKVFLSDSGMLHTLLGIRNREDVEVHPVLGTSWEGFIIDQIIRHTGAEADECFFWATHAGAELDLLLVRGRQRRGFEIKRSSAPGTTRSMHIALKDLKLQHLDVIHSGDGTFPLSENIRAVASNRLLQDIEPLT